VEVGLIVTIRNSLLGTAGKAGSKAGQDVVSKSISLFMYVFL